MSVVHVQKQTVSVHIRWMIRRDATEVLQIENRSFEHPWTEEYLCCCLRQRNRIGMVAEADNKVLGFMIYELYSHSSEIELLKIVVCPGWRRRNIGCQMVNKLIGKLSPYYWTKIIINLRETNLDGQLFFGKMKFKATSVWREFYHDTGEDAFVMEYGLYDKTDNNAS